jgi:hypothetical protein
MQLKTSQSDSKRQQLTRRFLALHHFLTNIKFSVDERKIL